MNLCNFNATKVQGNAIKLLLKTTKVQANATKAQVDVTKVQANATKVQVDVTKVQANATKVQLGEQAFAHPTKLNFHKKSDVDVGWVEG
ncbi:hypothetical protein [Nostoc sp. DedVER02]|uniref:hypothetical protein n=1 Tax=Nostoc sp. DedVER02 TaxID=3075405 RepID=UPI002AD58708|nr:hypothetical protein [Nostoc sp. DedVER02]MDZ7985803.1 hypothetical protein [Nostoc sp. DedVER02]